MKPIFAIQEDKAMQSMRDSWITKDPEVQARIRTSAAEVIEASTISWRAGFQAGLESAVLTLRQEHEELSKELMAAFAMETAPEEETKVIPMVQTINKVDIPKA